MKKKNFSFNIVMLLLAALFFAVAVGGCGGGSSGSLDDEDNPGSTPETREQPVAEEDSATRTETTRKIEFSMDSDGNGKPDFLDFYGVPQIHLNNSVAASSRNKISASSSILAAAEMNVQVPSMIWLDRLRPQSEDANIFLVALDKGQEYTFEFSKNFTEDLGGTLPNIKFYDPSNSLLSLEVAKEISDVTIAAYPPERPSIVCYTITPEVTGSYIVKICNGEPTTNEISADTDSVLFIYKERRNEDGKTGYYTRVKFQDAKGNKTKTVDINDIIQLRKLFLEQNPAYFDEVYGQKAEDDEYGTGEVQFVISEDIRGDYAYFMDKVQAKVGLVPYIDPDADIVDDDDNDVYGISAPSELSTEKIVASAGVSASALDDEPSSIETHVDGIPYENRYSLGRGYLAFSFLNPPGGREAELKEAFESYDIAMTAKEEAMQKNTSDQIPINTEYYAKFISTSSQAESLTKTSASVSIATAAAGISASTGSSNNFKFGLTSTNLVIHYEETEIDYRQLNSSQLYNSWVDCGFIDAINDDYPTGDNFLEEFRNDFGDYYVSGYQFGACFDAYISITTETSEQVKTLEQKIAGNLTYNGVTVSADAAKSTRDAISEAKAQITVRIVTSGMGHGPEELPLTHAKSSKDIAAIDDVFAGLANFRNSLAKSSDRSLFAPVRVKMTRYRQNMKLASLLKKKGDKTGKIPITVGQATKIAELNSNLRALRGYRNVVMDNSNIDGDHTKDLEREFSSIITKVTAANEKLYFGGNQADFDNIVKRVNTLSPKFKALGDRFTFYTKLMIAQREEKVTYDKLNDAAIKAGEGTDTSYENVRKMPFGSDHGGSSGYDQFAVSSYVTEDIKAGGDAQHKQYKRTNPLAAYRLEWMSDHKKGDQDYLASAGAATITASTKDGSEARFCKVWVNSLAKNNATDRHRELVNGSPAVGQKSVGFYFMGGRGDDVDWNIYGQSMRMRPEDYPFNGLQ